MGYRFGLDPPRRGDTARAAAQIAHRYGEYVMQTLFSANGNATSEVWAKWATLSAREFYDGEFVADHVDKLQFCFEKALAFPASLTYLALNCGTSYRRTWQHIRSNKVGFKVIWFISKGTLSISRSNGSSIIEKGQMGILDSDAPFHCKMTPGVDGMFESYQLAVPAYLFLAHLEGAEQVNNVFSLETPQGKVVQRMLHLLVKEGENLSRRTAKPLTESLLEALADCIDLKGLDISRRQSLVDKRLADIENYILMNLSDPDLCYNRVASNCGISPRYLCYVLKANNTSFSDLLWKNRLPRARDLLVAPGTRGYPIHEIAFMSGFKSAAHFSRMFKAAYGCPPREFRNAIEGSVSPTTVCEDDRGEQILRAA
ncbi:AraC family transcriptional regulator [Sphingobium sp. AN558]|uniref:helix-turn-helix domain-containing protein n=1 Tax=Sphingobium sp. AN558 TaxID=3133442 RepID=UPI0030BA8C13